MRAHPDFFTLVDDGQYTRPASIKHASREQLYTPPVWDVNLMDGRYIAAVIDKEKIVFKGRNVGFDIKFAFSKELAYLMGAAYNYQHLVWYHSKPMDKLYKEPKPKVRDRIIVCNCV